MAHEPFDSQMDDQPARIDAPSKIAPGNGTPVAQAIAGLHSTREGLSTTQKDLLQQSQVTTLPQERAWLSRLAWLPIPILLAAIIGLWAAKLTGSYEWPGLVVGLNFIFSTLASAFIAYLIGRSFLARSSPGLLLLGCGVVLWGAAGLIATAAARGNANISVTIHNTCVWLSALCHLAGVVLTLRPRRAMSRPGLWLPAGYALALGAVGLVTVAALEGWMPAFFVQGHGGTLVRQVVLGSTIGMFGLSALVLSTTSRRPLSAFMYWYSLALALIAAGLLGVMVQPSVGSLVGWTGRSSQFLGGVYMLIAAVTAVRESGTWHISLEEALRQSEERFRLVLDSSVDCIYRLNLQTGGYEYISPSVEAVVGYSPAEIMAMDAETALSMVHPDDLSAFRAALARLEETGRGKVEYRQRARSGEYRWVSNHMSLTRDPAGRPLYRNGNIRDITEQKLAEAGLRERDEQFAALIAHLRSGVALVDEHGRFSVFNSEFLKLFGLSSDVANINDQDWSRWQVFDEDGALLHVDEHPVRKAALTGKPVRDRLVRMKRPSGGNDVWMLIGAEPILTPDGRLRLMICTYHDVTERRKAEEALHNTEKRLRLRAEDALRMSEEEFRSLAEAMPQIVWATRPDGWNIYFNQQWVDYTGMTMEESYGHGWNTPFHPDDKQRAWDAWQRATQHNERYALECRLRRADGVYRWYLIRGSPMRGANGEILKWFGTCTDIEEIKHAEAALQEANDLLEQRVAERTAALRESEERFHGMFERHHAVQLVIEPQTGAIADANAAAVRFYGYSREELCSLRIQDINQLPPDEVAAERAKAAAEQRNYFVFPHRLANGEVRWVEVYSTPVETRGRPLLYSIIHDITDRKRAEDELARARSILIDGQRIAHLGSWEYVAATQTTVWSDEQKRIYGLDPAEPAPAYEEMLCRHIHPEDAAALDQAFGVALRTRAVFENENRIVRPDGSVRFIYNKAHPYFDDAGRLVRYVGATLDITDRKRVEESLRESEERFRLMGDTIPYGAWMADAEGRNIYISPLFLELVGRTFEQVKEFGWTDKMPPEDVEPIMRRWMECTRTGQDWEGELRFPSPDGRWHTILSRGKPVRDAQGQITAWVGINLDITERKQAEAAIQASLREKEVMLKEIHHRVKNNLQVIASLVDLQAGSMQEPGLLEMFADVRDRVRSMALVHEKLYQSESLAAVDFADYMHSLLSYLSRAHGKPASTIKLKSDLRPVALSVEKAVPCGLIVNELVSNAYKHAFRGRAEGEITAALGMGADGRVWLRVSDDGVGLPSGLDWRQSQSLGLRLIQLLAGQLHASVEVNSRSGTEFEISFELDKPREQG